MRSSRNGATVEDLKDDIVVISPQYLIQNYRLSKRRAMAVAIAAREICSRRWPRAKLCIADDTLDEVPSPFIKPNYGSKIRQSDFDTHAWDYSGAFLRAEIHDFLLVSACEEARIQLPERPLEVKGSTDGDRARPVQIPKDYELFARKAARNVGLLVGLAEFDRRTKDTSFKLKKYRARFRATIAKHLGMKNVFKMSAVELERVTHDVGRSIFGRGWQERVAESAILSMAARDAYEAAVEVYQYCAQALVR